VTVCHVYRVKFSFNEFLFEMLLPALNVTMLELRQCI